MSFQRVKNLVDYLASKELPEGMTCNVEQTAIVLDYLLNTDSLGLFEAAQDTPDPFNAKYFN